MLKKLKISRYLKDSLYKNSYYIMINTYLSAVLGFIFWIIATRLYTPYDIGLIVALISISGLITKISLLGTDTAVIRFLMNEKDKNTLINTCFSILLAVTFITSILFIIFVNQISPNLDFLQKSIIIPILFLLYTITSGLLGILNNVFTAFRESKYRLYVENIFAFLKIPLLLILIFLPSKLNIFAAWTISEVIALIMGLFFLRKSFLNSYMPKINFHKPTIKKISSFSLLNYSVNLFISLPIFILPIIIINLLNPAYNAFFYIAFTLSNVILIISEAISISLFAEGSFNESGFITDLKRGIKHAYQLLIPAIVVIFLFGDKILLIFGTEYSLNSSTLLSLLAVAGIFITINTFYITYLRIKMKMKELVILSFFTAMSIIFLSYFLIPFYQINAIGLSYLITYLITSSYIIIKTLKPNN